MYVNSIANFKKKNQRERGGGDFGGLQTPLVTRQKEEKEKNHQKNWSYDPTLLLNIGHCDCKFGQTYLLHPLLLLNQNPFPKNNKQ